MGYFGTYVYDRAEWRPVDPAINEVRQPVRGDRPPPDLTERWLLVDIHGYTRAAGRSSIRTPDGVVLARTGPEAGVIARATLRW